MEIKIFALPKSLAIPILPVNASGDSLLLLEDLAANPLWRLAQPEDMRQTSAGAASAA